ncbi:MAG: Octaprenyl diphosphate synthase [Myxococcaceae bacterium]|nr:Octaprenyl diphosphate synthase [Myxococcaceae bacterium]
MSAAAASTGESFLGRLSEVCADRGADVLAMRLAGLRDYLAEDLDAVERALASIDRAPPPTGSAIAHTFGVAGKRLRPLCVALAARVGSGLSGNAYELAVAVELVHNATLLHDDVVDLGDRRRGLPTARLVYGNAASIFAGDWLLTDALERIAAVSIEGLLPRMLRVLKQMLDAESIQLAARGATGGASTPMTMADYFRIVEGKTASLFGWALYAGGRAGGCEPAVCSALEAYGHAMGVAFQLVDDVLDMSADEAELGKALLTDVREGMLTHPVLVALERVPRLGALLAEARAVESLSPELGSTIARAVRDSGALSTSLAAASDFSARAIACLDDVPDGVSKAALAALAAGAVHRTR